MSQIAMMVVDARRAIGGQPHASLVDAVVAALAADPETVEELEAALARFVAPQPGGEFAGWCGGVSHEPYDAGLCAVDLAARLIVLESSYSSPGLRGEVEVRRGASDDGKWVPYHLADDWLLLREAEGWEALAEERRRQRNAAPPLDARAVLYGRPLCAFIAEECFAARNKAATAGAWTPPDGWSLRALPERAEEGRQPTSEDAAAEIHARWLVAPRDDLGGQSPRDVLLARCDHLSRDLDHRSQQWSFLGECPPDIDPQSAAYRLGGFGPHENIVYYDLVRVLTWECWAWIVDPQDEAAPEGIAPGIAPADEVLRLEQVRDEWLASPDFEDLGGRTPAEVIECERRRVPIAASGREAMVDDDCPLCQMMAEGMGPMFWCLDGCNQDDDFPFSHYRTREEYDEEQRRWEQIHREFEERESRRKLGLEPDGDLPWDDEAPPPGPWRHSYSATDAKDDPPSLALFGFGCHLSELGTELKQSPETEDLCRSLNRHFGNLREAVAEPSAAMIDPVVERLCEELHSAAGARPDLAERCADLERQLRELAARLTGEGNEEDREGDED